ncbi:kinetochore protein Spc25-like [Liolophura sinensis]|uniref:kinetochore protein Spc25-like n=1 Tax=Liolophura sinensis TaxID=3198878 RepID=UPI003159126E
MGALVRAPARGKQCFAYTNNWEMDALIDENPNWELEQVRETTKQVQTKLLNGWIEEELRRNTREMLRKREITASEKQDQILQLQNCLKKLKEDAATNKNEIHEREKELDEMIEGVRRVKLQVDDFLREKETMQETVDTLKKRLEREREYLSLQENATQSKLVELRKGLDWFQQRMGLEFRKTQDKKFQLIFTCVDRDDPKRPFYFSVKIEETGAYEVSDCNPPIKDLEALVEKLNQTNDFRSFMITMRSRFKQLT